MMFVLVKWNGVENNQEYDMKRINYREKVAVLFLHFTQVYV